MLVEVTPKAWAKVGDAREGQKVQQRGVRYEGQWVLVRAWRWVMHVEVTFRTWAKVGDGRGSKGARRAEGAAASKAGAAGGRHADTAHCAKKDQPLRVFPALGFTTVSG